MKRRDFIYTAAIGAFTFAGCETTSTGPKSAGPGKSHGHGPPPHAPAHGYRAKTEHGQSIRFDSGKGVYLVVDFPSHYYLDGKYYRLRTGNWEISGRIDGGWVSVTQAKLPSGLRVKSTGGGGPGKGKGKGKGRKK